ncbi:unnamed protein product [Angiostrongylus costaricensis]|uniref:VWFD domain-containing protein n=1 Tax=Angiostrongylus costaricensis TaxID=334426 RepID=A0A0R3PA96_ANGCS|nr:unnamed protein product [Angiostrongylus costaricensis]
MGELITTFGKCDFMTKQQFVMVMGRKLASMLVNIVAHVKVLNKSVLLMINSYEYVTYNLQKVKLFKISAEALRLSSPVMTTSVWSSCGVSLVEDEEYLLAGNYYDGNFLTSNCGQVIDDEQEGFFGRGPMKWENVTAEFLASLGSFKC